MKNSKFLRFISNLFQGNFLSGAMLSPGRGRRLHTSCWGRRRSPFLGARGRPGRCCPRPGEHSEGTSHAPESLYCKSRRTAMYILEEMGRRQTQRQRQRDGYKCEWVNDTENTIRSCFYRLLEFVFLSLFFPRQNVLYKLSKGHKSVLLFFFAGSKRCSSLNTQKQCYVCSICVQTHIW